MKRSITFLIFLFFLITIIFNEAEELSSSDGSSSSNKLGDFKPAKIEFYEDNKNGQQLASDDSSSSNNGNSGGGSGKSDSGSSSSNTAYIIVFVIFLIIALASLGLMIFCIRKYRLKRKELGAAAQQKNPLKKIATAGMNGKIGGGGGMASKGPGGVGATRQSAAIKSNGGGSVPKQITITGNRPGSASVPAKIDAQLAKKSDSTTTKTIPSPLAGAGAATTQKPPTKSPSQSSTTSTTTNTAPKKKKISTKKMKNANGGTKASERDVEPTQKSSPLEAIDENEEAHFDGSGRKMIHQKTFVCLDGNDDWHEANTPEMDDFSFEIESGNTFSMLSN